MKKKTELGKAMEVIQCYIGRKLNEAKKLKTQNDKYKFYKCLDEKGFRVEVSKWNNEVINICYGPYAWDCKIAYKKQQAKAKK